MFSLCQVFQRELTQGIIDVNNLIELGNELVNGKDNAIGAATVKLQLESTKSRWGNIEQHSTNRQQSLEDALENTFKGNVDEVTLWLLERDKQVDSQEFMTSIQDLELYVQVSLLH